jgi:hypothetical protein
MLDKNLLVTRIEQIDKHLERISLFSELSYEEFLNDINGNKKHRAWGIVHRIKTGTREHSIPQSTDNNL